MFEHPCTVRDLEECLRVAEVAHDTPVKVWDNHGEEYDVEFVVVSDDDYDNVRVVIRPNVPVTPIVAIDPGRTTGLAVFQPVAHWQSLPCGCPIDSGCVSVNHARKEERAT